MNTITLHKKTYSGSTESIELLNSYLFDMRETFKNEAEVVHDIEIALSEHIDELLTKRIDKKIQKEDVEQLRHQFGTIEQIREASEVTSDTSLVIGKKLYRDTEHKWIGGVAAGFAVYFGIPTWLMRLIFTLSMIPLPFVTACVYLVFWYIIPPVVHRADRLRMNGQPVSIATLSHTDTYTQKRMYGLAKIGAILLVCFMLLLATCIAIVILIHTKSDIWPYDTVFKPSNYTVEKDDFEIHYVYQCDNDQQFTLTENLATPEKRILTYNSTTNEYQKDPQTLDVYRIQNGSLQYSTLKIEDTSKDASLLSESGPTLKCYVAHIDNSQISVMHAVSDNFKIERCLIEGNVWNYRGRKCLSN